MTPWAMPASGSLSKQSVTAPASGWAIPVALSVFVASLLLAGYFPASERTILSVEVMRIWADHNWQIGTTSLPISKISVLAKQILSKQFSDLPDYLHDESGTIPVALMLRYINEYRYDELVKLCPSHSSCDVLTPDAVYNLTPLHLASFAGDIKSVNYLLELGADPDVFDKFHRKPANLTFRSFIANSKEFAELRGSSCQIPEIHFDPEAPNSALSEIHRLVAEGEPVVIRNLLQFMNHTELLEWNSASFLQKFGQANVTIGSVPYASYFGLESQDTSIEEYMARADRDIYVFNKNDKISVSAFKLLDAFVQMAFPIFFSAPHLLGPESIHFYLGQNGSGAPFHLHSDAVNLLTHGKKQWFITPPQQSVYSRLPVHEYLESGNQVPNLQCQQNAGDAMYIPFDWGHAVLNTEDETFGFAVELLNDRDSFRFLQAKS